MHVSLMLETSSAVATVAIASSGRSMKIPQMSQIPKAPDTIRLEMSWRPVLSFETGLFAVRYQSNCTR
jgi:hypothetical protein